MSYSYNHSHVLNTPARCLHTLSLQILILGSIVSIYTGGNQSSVRLNDCRYQSWIRAVTPKSVLFLLFSKCTERSLEEQGKNKKLLVL